MVSKHLGKILLMVTENRHLKLMFIVIFYVWEDAGNEVH